MATIASLMIDLKMNVGRLQADVAVANRTIDRGVRDMQRTMTGLKNTFQTVLAGSGFVLFSRAVLKEVLDAEREMNRLEAVIRATGGAAGFTRGQLAEMASALEGQSLFDAGKITLAQSELMKFGNIHGAVFRDGLKLATDLASFMGTDVPEAAAMIGKSLQSPTEGLTMMERQFGKLTAGQEEHIASLVRQNKGIEAQMAVIDLWRGKIGGTSDLMNTGLTKATNDVRVAWENMLGAFGETELVGGTAEKVLAGIAKQLNNIKNFAQGPGPLAAMESQLAMVGGEIERIERSRPAGRRSPLVDARLAELRAQRANLQEMLRAAQSKAADPFAFDPQSIKAKDLGGKLPVDDGREAKRRADGTQSFIDASIDPYVEAAERAVEMADDMVYTWDAVGERVVMTKTEFEKRREDAALMQKQLLDDIDRREAAEIEAGRMFLEAEGERRKALEDTNNIARDLGLTFTSAFEDAIVKGGDLRDVLKGIEQDIVRIIVRRKVTEPLAEGIGGFDFGKMFGGVFGGGGAGGGGGFDELGFLADGGPVSSGRPYIVGEEGPELFVPGASGAIVPNDAMGGGTYSPTYHIQIDARADASQVHALVTQAISEADARKYRSARYGGQWSPGNLER